MNSNQVSGIRRPSPHWIKFAAAGLLAAAIAGCGGGGTGANTAVQTTTMATSQWAEANFKVNVTSVQIPDGAPIVRFSVTDAAGAPVLGLNGTSKSSTATVASYPNLAFSLAKLVPGSGGSPGKWVNYVVTTVPTTTAVLTATRPSTDNTGTLVDNGDGSYQYTFYRDITKVKDVVATLAASVPSVLKGTNKAGPVTYNADDLGDLTYDPTKTHRLTVQLSGAARGTGTNTATGTTVTAAVNLLNPVNAIYDFVPATGLPVTASGRELVSIDTCNSCHEKLAFHGGGRVDTRYCVVCHTEQRKYGFPNVASVDGKFPSLVEKATVSATTGITSYAYSYNSTSHPAGIDPTHVADGEVAGEFTTMIHKIHQGNELVKENYNYANVAFNNKGFSMLGGGQKMCSACHDSTKAVNADNWNTQPSQKACGSCHDGINFKTGLGFTLADKAAGATVASNHLGGLALADDSTCASCHKAGGAGGDIAVVHRTENVTKHNPTVTAGLTSFTYEIKSAAVDPTTRDVTIEFKISAATADAVGNLGASAPVTFVATSAVMKNPLNGFTGAPSFMLPYALSQDGITEPVDYNNLGVKQAQANTVSIADLLNAANALTLGKIEASATAGYYKATILGANAKAFPAGSKLRAVALQGYFTQVAPAAARHAKSAFKGVTGDTARRTVVDPAKCSNCHEWFEGHGGNRVYETQVCVMCHTPGLATSGRGISDALLTGYPFSAADVKKLTEWNFDKTLPNAALKFSVTTNNFKDMIHGIHAGRDRVTPFMDARDRTSAPKAPSVVTGGAITLLDMRRMDFPGVLSKCSACHVSSTTATTTYNTVPSNVLFSTYESIDGAYSTAIGLGTATPALAKTALGAVSDTDAVTTPYAAACVSCHDNKVTNAHVVQNGGMVKVARKDAKLTVESCATCHGPGRTYDAAVVHK